MFNRVFLMGNLTRDPEVKYLPSGTPVTTFDIAVNEKYRDRNQQLKEETLFIRIDTFQRQAEICSQYLKKGSRVLVEGKLRQENWEGRDGQKHTRISVRAMNVQFLSPRTAEGERPAAAAASQPRATAAAPPARAATAAPRTDESDFPSSSDIPEYDVNETPYEAGPAESGADDDLPF